MSDDIVDAEFVEADPIVVRPEEWETQAGERPPPMRSSHRGDKVVTTIRVPKYVAAGIAAYARAQGATQGEAIRHLLEWALRKQLALPERT